MQSTGEITFDQASSIADWYERSVQPFLSEHSADQVPQLHDESRRLRTFLRSSEETVVCLVGVSGIGKSTLLNALVAQDKTVAPSGGVGPLTALATEVRHSEKPRLRAEYHLKKHLWQVASALNFQVDRQRRASAAGAPAAPSAPIEATDLAEIDKEVIDAVSSENEGANRRMDEIRRTARLMVAGNQNDDRPIEYLADALSVACSVKARWGTTPTDDDAKRIARISQALQMAEKGSSLVLEQGDDARAFRETLREHAAGFLSPLIRRIEVGWPSEILKTGLVLVDLPGIGVAGDVYKRETQRFVRERARAVVVVVDRAGPTESVMDLLRATGYWDRLLLASDDPSADPCSLVLAVTRVDDVATEEWYAIDPDEEGRRPRTKAAVFVEVREKLREAMLRQFEHQLAAFTQGEGSETIRAGREAAARNLLASLEIHPVSAIEYRRLLANNDDDKPFLNGTEQSGIPHLADTLQALARTQRDKRAARLRDLTRRFAESLLGQLQAVESSWRGSRAEEQAEKIREALQVVLADKNREFENRRASFRTFLKQTVPAKIGKAVLEAKDVAEKDVRKYLRGLRDAHWATLRAAVTRGGTYYGARHINLPSDIALRFQDPVAAVWSQSLLKDIRTETYSLAGDMRQMVEEVCDWAEKEAGAYMDEKVIATQKKLVSGQVERLRDVGKEAIDDLRTAVKVGVVEAIENPIRLACKKFVEEGSHIGPGVKYRILELFDDLASSSTDDASRPAERTLLTHYGEVDKEIRRAFKEWGNPIESAGNAIVERHEDRVRRSDSQKRARVLAAVEKVKNDAPPIHDLAAASAPVTTGSSAS